MTNTQNVTELQPRMTREQLIDAARKAAPLLPAAYGWMVNELAEQNATLREDVASWAKECDRIEERHTKTPTNMHLLEAQRELRELSTVVISQNNEVAL